MEQYRPPQRIERLKEVPQEIVSIRTEVIASLPNRVEGINKQRIQDFMASFGLPTKEVFFFYNEDISMLKTFFQFFPYAEKSFLEGAKGMYIPELDIALVLREPNIEKENGESFTESLAVHELAHASSRHHGVLLNDFDQEDSEYRMPRVGFLLKYDEKYPGGFFEEAFAELMLGEYLSICMPASVQRCIAEALQHEGDISPETQAIMFKNNRPELQVPIAYKYIYFSHGAPTFRAYAIVVAGMQLLFQKKPELKDFFLENRKSTDTLRTIARMIDEISPGLYLKLRQLKNSEEEFWRGYDMIQRAVA